jgi:mannitol/fructose-specific phosphotransferase system IIA component (Ntr-type)
MNIDYFLQKNEIIKIDAKEKQHVFKVLLDHLQEIGKITSKERYYAQIVHRESLENTGIGNGLAIPHARTESLEDFVSIFGILSEPLDYQSIDDEPVKFVLLSLFPTEKSTKYLYMIGMMARIFSNSEKKKLLYAETAPSKVYTILNRETKAYFESISDKDKSAFGATANLSGVPSSDLDLLIRLDRLYNLLEETPGHESYQKKIVEIKKLIDNRSLTYFERMRKKRNNPFAIVEKDSCTGCHMEIPPFDMKKVRDREGVSVCTHCGRFLIFV